MKLFNEFWEQIKHFFYVLSSAVLHKEVFSQEDVFQVILLTSSFTFIFLSLLLVSALL